MKKFKRFAALALIVPFLMLGGCAGITTAINDVGGFITGTAVPDACAAAAYYEKYLAGVASAVSLVPVVGEAVGPYVAAANTAIANLNADCQSGALLSTITADIGDIDNAIANVNTIVGQAQAAGMIK